MTTVETATMLDAALWWASKGVPVLPLHYPCDGKCSCGGSDCANAAKHPLAYLVPHGLTDATVDAKVIRSWWVREPEANIGIRTGIVFDLLDIDSADGAVNLQKVTAELGLPEHLGVVTSGRDGFGMHFYVAPGGMKALHQGKTAPTGIDVKGRGGYAVAPPSRHISGRRYTWQANHFNDGDLQGNVAWELFYSKLVITPPKPPRRRPTALIAADAADAYGRAVLDRALELVRCSVSGNRWQTLAIEAIPLIARGIDGGCLDRDTVVRQLEDAARDVGLEEREVTRISGLVDDMLSAGITHPISPKKAALEFTPLPVYDTEDEARADPWEPPWPLRYPTPPFPVDVLGWAAPAVRALADDLQVPTDLVGMMLLAAISATVRGRARAQVNEGWEEPLNLWCMAILAPGETKSPALSRILAPLREMEKQARETAQAAAKKAAFDKEIAEEQARKARDQAGKAKMGDQMTASAEAWMAQQAADDIVIPPVPLYLAGDMTPEALVAKLAEQNGTLAHISAEGQLMDTIAGGRYSGGAPQLSSLLCAHDGREPIRVHRKHDADVEVPDPSLTLGLAVQPHVLEQLGRNEAAVKRGLTARFLFTVPASLVGRRDMRTQRGVAPSDALEKLLRRIDEACTQYPQNPTDVDLGREGFEDKKYIALKLSVTASSSSLLDHYRETLEPRRAAETGDLAEVGAWANKLDGEVVRLAALLQLVYDTDTATTTPFQGAQNPQNQRPIGPDAMAGALVLADYLIDHAVEAHAVMNTAADTATHSPAQQLLGWLRLHQCTEFRSRDAQQSLRKRVTFREPGTVHAACNTLERLGWIRRLPDDDTEPGRPSPRYLVHPDTHQ